MNQLTLELQMKSNISAAINHAHQAVKDAERAVVTNAAECGRLLNAAKATVEHGKWTEWVNDHCKFSMRTAQLYMKLADYLADKDPAKAQRVADLSLREIQGLLADPDAKLKDRETDEDKRRQVDKLLEAWVMSGPMERRAFVLAMGARGVFPMNEVVRQLKYLNKYDGPADQVALGHEDLISEGLDPDRAFSAVNFIPASVDQKKLREAFGLVGPKASALAVVMASKLRPTDHNLA